MEKKLELQEKCYMAILWGRTNAHTGIRMDVFAPNSSTVPPAGSQGNLIALEPGPSRILQNR